jgi:RimJ/RimL family protein N-acetyltransferase
MKAPIQVRTARLVLVAPQPADAQAIFDRYASDPEVTRFLGWPRHRSVEDTQAFLAFSAEEWDRWPEGPYLIRLAIDDRLLGGTGFSFERPDQAVTGYVLATDAWGHGFATEALRAITDIACTIGVATLHAVCHAEHVASQRVLEKCGFSRDLDWTARAEFPNLAPDSPQEAVRYSLVIW